MTLRFPAVSAIAVALSAAQTAPLPAPMAPLQMLSGEWAVQGKSGEVSFEFSGQVMIGRARPLAGSARWRRFMILYEDGNRGPVRAEFFDSKDHVTHYRLASASASALRFADEPATGSPTHFLKYEQQGPGRVTYQFATGSRVTDSGLLVRAASIRPLRADPKLVRPLSE